MSHKTRRKHVMREFLLDNLDLPEENQTIVKVLTSRGNYLFDVEHPRDEETFLVSMPTKFRKNMWVKRGDYLLVEPIEEGNKVKAEIIKILMPEHIKEFTQANIWPEKFTQKPPDAPDEPQDFTSTGNPNRRQVPEEEDDSSSSESE